MSGENRFLLRPCSATAATYRELLDRAETALGLGETVVLDASWTDDAQRAAARRVAASTFSDVVELQCVAPQEVAMERIRRRAERGGDASDADADAAIASAMAAVADPWPTSAIVDTVVSPEDAVQVALSAICPMTEEHSGGPPAFDLRRVRIGPCELFTQ